FEQNGIKFTNDCTKATVTTTVTRDWTVRTETNVVVVPMITTWKIEKDKWVWYHDTKGEWITPMGPSNVTLSKNPDGSVNLPKNLGAEVIAAAANAILTRSGLDKGVVVIDPTKISQDQVVFTNAVQGSVQISLAGVPDIPGLQIKIG